jgi:hypothetical protein
MGGNSSTERTTITNKIEIYIDQTNEQYNKIVKSSITNVMTNASNKQKATVSNDSSAFNDIELSDIHISNMSHMHINVKSTATLTAKALLSITQSETLMQNIANQAQDNIKQSIEAKQDLKSDIQLVSDIQKKKEISGELNKFIDSVQGMVDDLFKGGTTEETDIENDVKQQLKTKDVTSSDIKSFIQNSFNTNIDVSSINTCLSNSNASNHITLKGIWIDGSSSLETIVAAYTTQVQDCIISTLLTTDVVTALQNLDSTTADQDTKAGQSADTKTKTDNSIIKSDIVKSFLDIIMNNLTLIIAIIGVVVVLGIAIIGGPAIAKMFTSVVNKRPSKVMRNVVAPAVTAAVAAAPIAAVAPAAPAAPVALAVTAAVAAAPIAPVASK